MGVIIDTACCGSRLFGVQIWVQEVRMGWSSASCTCTVEVAITAWFLRLFVLKEYRCVMPPSAGFLQDLRFYVQLYEVQGR